MHITCIYMDICGYILIFSFKYTTGYADLAMPNYITSKNGAILGTSSIRTTGGLGQPGLLVMYDSTGLYNDPDTGKTFKNYIFFGNTART